jgi:3-methyl-2-oxobutanoate hydroxymethyltransferase
MQAHTRAVAAGKPNRLIIADLPFMSYRKSQHHTLSNVQKLMASGAQAIKLEGAEGNLDTIYHMVHSGVPVMGHLGLTPQHIHTLGGFKAQGKTQQAQQQILKDAKSLEEAGCFAIVLECVPGELAKTITTSLSIPTIGIGAGPDTDGQVLVFHDLLGLQNHFKPKFLKTYLDGKAYFSHALNQFSEEVKKGVYPAKEHCYIAS